MFHSVRKISPFFVASSLLVGSLPARAVNEPLPEHVNKKGPQSIPPTFDGVVKLVQEHKWKILTKVRRPGSKTVVFLIIPRGEVDISETDQVRLRTLRKRFPSAHFGFNEIRVSPLSPEMETLAKETFFAIVGREPKQERGEHKIILDQMVQDGDLFELFASRSFALGTSDPQLLKTVFLCRAVERRLREAAADLPDNATAENQIVLKSKGEWVKPYRNIFQAMLRLEVENAATSFLKLDGTSISEVGDDGYATAETKARLLAMADSVSAFYNEKIVPRHVAEIAWQVQEKVDNSKGSALIFVNGTSELMVQGKKSKILPAPARIRGASYLVVDFSQ